MERRIPDLEREYRVAFGLKAGTKTSRRKLPPAWALAALKRFFGGKGFLGLLGAAGPDESRWSLQQWGRFSAISGLWGAALSGGTEESAVLEKKHPKLGEFRKAISAAVQPRVELIQRDVFSKLASGGEPLTVKSIVDFSKGQHEGTVGAVDVDGEPRDDFPTTQVICFYLWLFAPEIARLENLSQVKKFFESLHEWSVTQELLEKVARDIKLKLKGRGAPLKKIRLQKKRK